jgi:hypothetical protein
MTTSSEAMVTTPPDVVRILASSTVFVKASSLVNLDLAGMFGDHIRCPGTIAVALLNQIIAVKHTMRYSGASSEEVLRIQPTEIGRRRGAMLNFNCCPMFKRTTFGNLRLDLIGGAWWS